MKTFMLTEGEDYEFPVGVISTINEDMEHLLTRGYSMRLDPVRDTTGKTVGFNISHIGESIPVPSFVEGMPLLEQIEWHEHRRDVLLKDVDKRFKQAVDNIKDRVSNSPRPKLTQSGMRP